MKSSAYKHLIGQLLSPLTAQASQAAYDIQRMKDVEASLTTRPEFLQVQHDLPAAVQTIPISEQTDSLNYDVIVNGVISDAEDRDGFFYRRRNEPGFIDLGNEVGTRFNLDAIAGKCVAAGGVQGVQRLPAPILLRERDTLSVDMFQDTAVADKVTTVFTAERVYPPSVQEAQLSTAERGDVSAAIARYSSPQPRYLTIPVTFDGNGIANVETPKQDEPILILGFRSTFTDALINIGRTDTHSWARQQFAIWALCAEPGNTRLLFQHLQSPIFVPPKERLRMSLTNTIDGTLFATDGTIQVLAVTP